METGIGIVIGTGSIQLRNTLIRAIKETSGIAPAAKCDTSTVRRALYKEAVTRAIINTASPEVQEQLGSFSACATIEVENPTAAAEKAKGIFEAAGYDSTIHLQVEPELPPGFMAFLVVSALRGVVLLFWPKNPDKAVVDRYRSSGESREWYESDYNHDA